jgi:RNA polymerase sigma-70 factor (ECF subfamily)
MEMRRSMQDSPEGFAALLARARDGDEASMALLVEQYEPQVRAVARARLGTALRPYLDTVDLVQSVHRSLMVGVSQNKFDISSPEKLIGLAIIMVQRKVARQWRRVKRQERDSGAAGDLQRLAHRPVSLSSPESDPASAAEFQDKVRTLLETLDATDRRLIELRLEGRSTADAARTLGVDADVLRVRLSRLRQRLRASSLIRDI